MAGNDKSRPLFPANPGPSPETAPTSGHKTDCECLACRVKRFAAIRSTAVRPVFIPTEVVPQTPVKNVPMILPMADMRIRKRLEVSIEDLRTMNSDVADPVLEKARAEILVVNLEDAGAQFLQPGLAAQERFASTSGKMLALTTNPQLDVVNRELREIGALLSATELSQMFLDHSGWKSWFGGSPHHSFNDAKVSLMDRVDKVNARSASLREDVPKLYVLKVEADVVEQQLAELIPQLETALAVARFLISHLKLSPERIEWVDSLQRRTDSLLMARITARQAMMQLQLIKQHLRHLTETVQTALVNLVPAWCGNCVSFLSSVRQSEVPDKDKLGPLTTLRDNILKLIAETEN